MRLPIILLFSFAAGTVLAQSSSDEAFENLSHQYLMDLARFSPVSATLIGDHSADDQLDQVDDAARRQL